MKYILKDDNYFSHIGTDPVVNAVPLDEDKRFNLDNPPAKFHKWNGDEFTIDNNMYKVELVKQAEQIVFARCDVLQEKIIKNESYRYAENYQSVKDNLIQQIRTQRARITTFASLTVQELEQTVDNF